MQTETTSGNIPSSFRAMQREAGIWAVNKDSFLEGLKPRSGQEKAVDAVNEMMYGIRKILMLTGESRGGKSWICSAVINSRLKIEYSKDNCNTYSRYMTFFDLELALRTAQTLGRMDTLFNDLVRVPFLAIDELGRGKWSEFTSTFFTNLLIRRHGENRPTLVASNLKAQELRDMLDMALLERIKESNGIVLVERKE